MKKIRRLTAALCLAALGLDSFATSVVVVQPDYRKKGRDLLADMVSYRTIPGENKVNPLHHKLASMLRQAGFAEADVAVIDTDPEVSALVVRLRGDGTGGRPILLMSHSDVVTAVADAWTTDPFQLVEKDGFFYGRGVLDNKAGAAAQVMAFVRLRAEAYVPQRDYILMITGDEETTGRSAKAVLAKHRDLVDAEFALNSDSGGGRVTAGGARYLVQAAEKSYIDFELITRNVGGHSSRPRVDNAIYDIADAIKKLQAYRFPVRHSEVTRSYLHQNSALYEGDIAAAMRAFAADPDDAAAADMLFAQPSLVGRTRTTCIPTVLNAGHANNAQPRSAHLVINCRVFPGVSFAEVQAVLEKQVDNPALEFKILGDPESSPGSELNPVVMAAVAKVVRRRLGDVPIIPTMEVGATDGVFTRAAGIPTFAVSGYVYDPDDDRKHGKDESNPVESFYGELDHWYELIKELSDK